MKRLILPLAMMALLVASCGDVIEIPDVDAPSGGKDTPVVPPGPSGDFVFTATAENLSDGTAARWKSGETISLYDGASFRTLTNEAENGSTGRFKASITGEEEGFMAVRPAQEGLSADGDVLSVNIPTELSLDDIPAPLQVAKTTGSLLYFRNTLATLTFKVGFEGATKVQIKTTDGSALTGDATVDYSGNDLIVSASDDMVELCGNFVRGQTYSVFVAPGIKGGYKITCFSGTEESAEDQGGQLNLMAGITTDLPVLGEEVPTYRITNLWLWGGTGPSFGCTLIYDLFTKSDFFNNEDGRGVTALQDNYFELRPSGSFRNWAGEDGRNWWFIYKGSENPETGKDIDLTAIYDVIPRGEGMWSLSGDAMTFTRPDGTSTSAQVLLSGSYPMPGTKPEISLNIKEGHIALQFTLTGGKDNFVHRNDDYGVIACNPRALFFELEQLPSGTYIPKSAKTTDTDFEFTSL